MSIKNSKKLLNVALFGVAIFSAGRLFAASGEPSPAKKLAASGEPIPAKKLAVARKMQSAYRAHKAKTEFYALWAQIAESVNLLESYLPSAFLTEQLAWIDSHYKDIENKLNRVKLLRWINETERATLIGASEEKLKHFRRTIDSRRASSSVPSAGGASAGASDSDSEGAAGAGKATVVEDPLLPVQRRVDNFLRRRDNGELRGDHGRAELQNISDDLRVIYEGAGSAAYDIKEKIHNILNRGSRSIFSYHSTALFGKEDKCFKWLYDLDSVALPVALPEVVAPLTRADINSLLRQLEDYILKMKPGNRDPFAMALKTLSDTEQNVRLEAEENQAIKIGTAIRTLEAEGAIREDLARELAKRLSDANESLYVMRRALDAQLRRSRK